MGDVLREEVEKGDSPWEADIRVNMAAGKTGSPEMTVPMLQKAIERKCEEEEKVGEEKRKMVLLVDGCPRSIDRISLFEETSGPPSLVLSLECALHIARERLRTRSQHCSRIDDGAETVQNRFDQYFLTTKPVIAHYQMLGLVAEIDAGRSVEAVHADIWEVVRRIL
ncbi:hypothetical protein DSL72_002916 [Monilinia vaccinii-corymbosi]|uniref:Adenylate kinase n=1 Tax=Monilinia vaccinii-corymbosi TaxID=61207 RepID=A0A8A3PDX4_9HELO|nr:hypothetical protein DSL72_002916 [Monilinia vaccinii-corymbosi]